MSVFLLISFTESKTHGIGHYDVLKSPNLGTYSGNTLTTKLDTLIKERIGVIVR